MQSAFCKQSFSSPVALANLNGQDLLRPSCISMFQTPRIATPDSRIHPTPCSRMQTPARANHERSPIVTGIEWAMNIENECRTSPSQAPCDRRFYVDLSAISKKCGQNYSKGQCNSSFNGKPGISNASRRNRNIVIFSLVAISSANSLPQAV